MSFTWDAPSSTKVCMYCPVPVLSTDDHNSDVLTRTPPSGLIAWLQYTRLTGSPYDASSCVELKPYRGA